MHVPNLLEKIQHLTCHELVHACTAHLRLPFWLNEGIAVDAQHQRIWLTLGYVNAQLGFTEQARKALTNAVEIGDSESIRQSATQMLEALP